MFMLTISRDYFAKHYVTSTLLQRSRNTLKISKKQNGSNSRVSTSQLEATVCRKNLELTGTQTERTTKSSIKNSGLKNVRSEK